MNLDGSIQRSNVIERQFGKTEQIAVQSQHLFDLLYDTSFWLGCPDFADVFVGCEAVERLKPSGEVEGCQEVR